MPRQPRSQREEGPPSKSAPMPLSQAEVDALAAGAPSASAIRRRLPPSRPSAGAEARTNKARPVAISRSELLALRRGGRAAALRARIEARRGVEPESGEYTTQKSSPTEPPPNTSQAT